MYPKPTILALIVAVILLGISFIMTLPKHASGQGTATFALSPTSGTFEPGNTFTVDLTMNADAGVTSIKGIFGF